MKTLLLLAAVLGFSFTGLSAAEEKKEPTPAQAAALIEARRQYPAIAITGSPLNIEATRLLAEYAGSEILKRGDGPLRIAIQSATNVAAANATANGSRFSDELAKLALEIAPTPPAVAKTEDARPTQYNGRPLPRNWIDPRQADANHNAQQLLRQQQATQEELRRLRQSVQSLR